MQERLEEVSGAGTIWTVGHSTLPAEQFIALLVPERIALIADVRRFSRLPTASAIQSRCIERDSRPIRHRVRASPGTGWQARAAPGFREHRLA